MASLEPIMFYWCLKERIRALSISTPEKAETAKKEETPRQEEIRLIPLCVCKIFYLTRDCCRCLNFELRYKPTIL